MTDKSETAQPSGLPYAMSAYLIWGFVPVYFKLLSHVSPIAVVAQRAVDTGRAHLQPPVIHVFHFKQKLQLARDLFAVFHGDKLLGACRLAGLPRQINGDAQHTPGGTLQLHQVVTQPGNGLLNCVLPCHCCVCSCFKKGARRPPAPGVSKAIDQKKWAGDNPPIWS